MPHRSLLVLISLPALVPTAHAAPTGVRLCEAAMELASAKYAQCRLTAEQRYSKNLDAARRTAALARCSTSLGEAFSKATARYGAACAATEPSSAFEAFLTACADDVAAAAGGAALPDDRGALAQCNASLATARAISRPAARI